MFCLTDRSRHWFTFFPALVALSALVLLPAAVLRYRSAASPAQGAGAALAGAVRAGATASSDAASGAPSSSPANDAVTVLLRSRLDGAAAPQSARLTGERAGTWRTMQALYARRAYRPVWVEGSSPTAAGRRLISVLDAVGADGLDARLYSQAELRRLVVAAMAPLATSRASRASSPSAASLAPLAPAASLASMSSRAPETPAARDEAAADLDMGLTYAFLTVAEHLAAGRVQAPELARVGWYAEPRQVDLATALERALAVSDGAAVQGALESLAPAAPGYVQLREALAAYRAVAARGGWPPVPGGSSLRLGDRGPRVAALAARLISSYELGAGDEAVRTETFGPALAAALARFQESHGLAGSGVLDGATLAELNVPAAERARQIELNLERWRWSAPSPEPESRYIVVNIPDYRLHVVENGRSVLTMRVIVGQTKKKTPIFNDVMTALVLNPRWHIPDSIVTAEIVPQLLRDRDYLSRKGYRLRAKQGAGEDDDSVAPAELSDSQIDQLGRAASPYRLEQPSGARNALGRYKFVLRNPFDVYLHDTPSGGLFARSERDLSHGCVRLEKPADLAAYLLRDNKRWTPDGLRAALASGETVAIPLAQRVPVHIFYRTAWVAPDGHVEFRPDIYHLDSWLAAALAAQSPLWQDLQAMRQAPAPSRPVLADSLAQPGAAAAAHRPT